MSTPTRWQALMGRLGLTDQETGAALLRSYADDGRAYHNLSHLAACLHWLDEVRPHTGSADEIELALWFHDAVYDPRRSDNEDQSAQWAQQFLHNSGSDAALTERVTALVRVTDHRRTPQSEDERWIVDIDLTILGSATDVYARYEEAIRQEYAWVPLDVYQAKRSEVLRSFLGRERIYATDYFHTRLDEQARRNLAWAIQRLTLPKNQAE